MLTFKHAFNSKNSSGYLGSCHGKPFLLLWYPISCFLVCDGSRMRDQWVLLLPPKIQSKVKCVCVFWRAILFSSLWRALPANTHTHTSLWTKFWEAREERIDPSFSDHHAPGKQLIGYQRRRNGFPWHEPR